MCVWCSDENPTQTTPNGELVCQECYDNAFVACAECTDITDYDNAERNQDNEYYCSGCYGRHFTICVDCGAEVERNSSDHKLSHGDDYCESCFNDRYASCANCNHTIDISDLHTVPSGDSYCYDCFMDSACNCHECSRPVWIDDAYENHQGHYTCQDCRHSTEWRAVDFRPDAPTFTNIKSERKFGVEFETSVCEDYHEMQGQTVFGAKPDGSVDGMEFVSPILYADQGLEEIRNVCRLSNARNHEVDTSCGLHVHLDMTEASDDQLYSTALAYHYTYDLWASFVSNSRVRNYYCAKHDYTHTDCRGYDSFRDFVECATYSERYRWINWAAYVDHRTVEIRIHGGTLSARKTINWVKVHARFIDAVQDLTVAEISRLFGGKTTCEQFAALAEMVDDDELITFYAERAEHFGKSVMAEESEESELNTSNLELAS